MSTLKNQVFLISGDEIRQYTQDLLHWSNDKNIEPHELAFILERCSMLLKEIMNIHINEERIVEMPDGKN